MNSYEDMAAKNADRQLLDIARLELGISPSALCLDDCELWQLRGSRGRITTWGDGESYLLSIYEMRSARAYSGAKKRLRASGCTIPQDGELEGVFRVYLPLPAGVNIEIRELGGFRKALSEETVAALSERARRTFGHVDGVPAK